MGRMWIELDSSGWYLEEPGFPMTITGAELFQKYTAAAGEAAGSLHFFNVPGSPWLLPQPRQWSPTWYQDARLSEHVLTKAHWTWAPEVNLSTHVTEFEGFTKVPTGASYPANKWLTVVPPASFTSLKSVGFGALFTAAGMAAPAGIGVIANATTLPVGTISPEGADNPYSPYLQCQTFPQPLDLFCFGWGHYVCLIHRRMTHILRATDATLQDWSLVARWMNNASQKFPWGNLHTTQDAVAVVQSLLCMPLGYEELAFYTGSSGSEPVVIRREAAHGNGAAPFKAGSWWLAAAPGQRMTCQVQVVGYEEPDTRIALPGSAPPILLDLGSSYKPTKEPKITYGKALTWVTAGSAKAAYEDGLGPQFREFGDANNFIEVDLVDETRAIWSSDGTHHKGGIEVRLQPASNKDHQAGAYAAPQLHSLIVRFPPKLALRTTTPLLIDDTKWAHWRAEASLYGFDDKRIQIDLKPETEGLLVDAGLDERDRYLFRILEDADNDGTPETVRVKGMIVNNILEELVTEAEGGRADPLRLYTLHGRGLLWGANQPWRWWPPLIVNAANPVEAGHGELEHTDAIREILFTTGFEVSDEAVVKIYPDPAAGTARARLPGTWAQQDGSIDSNVKTPWAPDPETLRIEYAEFIAHAFAGWSFYETLSGKVLYHPDLTYDLLRKGSYYVAATIHRSTGEAELAGQHRFQRFGIRPHPGRTITPVQANEIRVSGRGTDGTAIHVVDRNPGSINNPTTAEKNYVGAPVLYAEVPKLAVTEEAAKNLARKLLLDKCRRVITRSVSVWRAPWQIFGTGPGLVELAQVLEFRGRGDYRLVHLEVDCISSRADDPSGQTVGSLFLTRLTGEKVPPQAVKMESGFTESYPGRAEATPPP